MLQDDGQTLEQCKFNDYDLVTCQRSRRKFFDFLFGISWIDNLAVDGGNPGATTMPRRNLNGMYLS